MWQLKIVRDDKDGFRGEVLLDGKVVPRVLAVDLHMDTETTIPIMTGALHHRWRPVRR